MSYKAGAEPILPMVSAMGRYAPAFVAAGVNPSSAAFESAARAVYFPIELPSGVVARRMWWANGSAVSASFNIDAGIYSDANGAPGTRLVSTGSTAQGTATQVQFVDITDTVLPPGSYWLALTCSSVSATFFRATFGGSASEDALFRFQEASALPLPATATPVETTSQYMYLFGFATTASP